MIEDLERNGFVLMNELRPEATTLETASALGKVLDIQKLLPLSRIPTVQSLRPRYASSVGNNQYSGIHGLDAFPLHTDLAHWTVPPRYFILRCIVPAEDVCTLMLPWATITPALGSIDMRKAVFTGRRKHRGCSGLVRAMSCQAGNDVRRWDAMFLKPLNQPARELDKLLREARWMRSSARVPLRRTGDTILIDNWRTLHGRDSVPPDSRGRLLERAYLSELFI
jgi:L-asparagine oxygenase